ncbi:PAS domain S-box protein [Massilia sp. DJPM01]|uniref:PAS domain S-box protein n=1 Tax=Massilia sp. DJPM01 TaxID=3024404 RepID=UPI00259E8993|nr:PAS domain S-box protein [Massilia sp. DJPM01]MDM5178404.1 PAS domain S-box protein [Massilia sp. DJPM01]
MNDVPQSNKYGSAALIARYQSAGKRCGQGVAALGLAVLVGWMTGTVTLTNINSDWAPMRPIAALCLILSGTSLFAAGRSRINERWRIVQLVSATIVFGIALITLAEYAFGLHFRVDQYIPVASASVNSGRMAIAAATSYLLAGAALAFLDTSARRFAQPLALLLIGVSTLAIMGYAYGVSEFYHSVFFATVALHTAVGTLLVGIGILLVRPTNGVVAVLVSGTVGGVLARRLLPLAVATPLLIGWLRIEGERQAFYDSSLGVALTSLAYVILFALFTWRDAEALRRNDVLRLDAEQIKKVQQSQLNGLIESAMDAIIMLDAAHRIIVFNPAAEQMFGYASADMLGIPLGKLLPERFRAVHEGQMHAFGLAGATPRQMGNLGSVAAIRADGTEFPVEASISHFEVGDSVHYLAILRDITDRRRTEVALHVSEQRERVRSRELTRLLFTVPAGVCITHDRLLSDMSGNELYEHWFLDHQADESTPPAPIEPTGHIPVMPQPTDDIRSWKAALQQAANGTEMRAYEFKHVHPNGSVRYLFGNAVPLCDEHGVACGAIAAFVDVTELKMTEQAILSVTAASVAKSDYITHLTHELRTPLGTILGYAQLLEMEKPAPSPGALAQIGQIIKAGRYLCDLINEVQELAKIEAHAAGLASEPILVDPLVHNLCEMIAPLVLGAGLQINIIASNGLGIHCNPVRIKQVMLNLLSNAIKYNRRGGSIDVSYVLVGAAQLRICVRDTGHGLTTKEMASLFQPFNRLGQERGGVDGTGVGLVVTKKLVESMGGTIGVESEVGRGSLFWFTMPTAQYQTEFAESA